MLLTKCLHDYSTVKELAFILHSGMKEIDGSTVEKTVFRRLALIRVRLKAMPCKAMGYHPDDQTALISGMYEVGIKYPLTDIKTYVTLQNKTAQDSKKF